ncbi:MAG: hypothetical protein NTV80_02930 [Verrucomicrobia bacterium]|nr:hypothetical protein [Verrucomicrobiota bacterium]
MKNGSIEHPQSELTHTAGEVHRQIPRVRALRAGHSADDGAAARVAREVDFVRTGSLGGTDGEKADAQAGEKTAQVGKGRGIHEVKALDVAGQIGETAVANKKKSLRGALMADRGAWRPSPNIVTTNSGRFYAEIRPI